MTNNEPLYGLLKAHQMKMYRAVEAKRVHEDMVKYFNNIADYNKKKMSQYDIMIRLNKLINLGVFGKFWELVEA